VAPILLHAEGDTRTGLGHLVRMVGVAGDLAASRKVHLASASPHLAAVVRELAPWSSGPFEVHALAPSLEDPWSRGPELAEELTGLARALAATVLVSDGKATYPKEAFASLRGHARVVLVDNVVTDPSAYDLLVLPTCHADPAVIARVGAEKVRTGADWTFVHPAVRAAAARPRGPGQVVFVSMGGADPNGLTGRAIAHLLATTTERVVVVCGPANLHRASLEALAAREPRLSLVSGSPASQDALAASAWALCAFGITAYEAVALGIPLVVVPHDGVIDGDIERFVAAFPGQVTPSATVEGAAVPSEWSSVGAGALIGALSSALAQV
jgi:spore coat polysaccharide biosynthesis predicted glycosyltransferase SpsG